MPRNPLNTLSARRNRAFHARVCGTLTLLVAVGLLVNPFSALSRVNESKRETINPAPQTVQLGEDVDSFIIEAANGVIKCREARPEEVPLTLPRPEDRRTPVTQNYLPDTHAIVSTGENVGTPLTINLVALSQLSSNPNQATIIAAFQKAAANWTARIKSPTTVTLNIDFGPNPPGSTQPFGANTLGATSSRLINLNYSLVRNNLNLSASNPTEASVYAALPTGTVPTDTGNGGIVSVSRTVARQLGLISSTTPLDDATIGFNSAFNFDFNPDDGITIGQYDFVAVATHEIGHALGFTSGAGGSATAPIRLWDLFRFHPGTTSATFPTAQRIMSLGTSANDPQVYFTGETFQRFSRPLPGSPPSPIGTTQELGLSTGGPVPNGGDGNQSSHWKADEQSGVFVGIMDPTISVGTRVDPTDNDFLVLEMIGWDLTGNAVIPSPPAPLNDNFADAFTLVGCGGSVFGSNFAATKETNEPDNADSPTSTRSVWYAWQAPSSGSVTINTQGSDFDTVLQVFTGGSFGSLSPIAHNDDAVPGSDLTSLVTFNATQGTTYRIAVNGFNNNGSGGDMGSITLNWTETGCTEPARFLIPETSDPSRIVALDSVTFVRGPFHINETNNFSANQRTRVMFMIFGLGLTGADISAVSVQAGTTPLQVENVGPLMAPGLSATYVNVLLPSGLSAGPATFPLNVSVRGVACSNNPVLQIAGP